MIFRAFKRLALSLLDLPAPRRAEPWITGLKDMGITVEQDASGSWRWRKGRAISHHYTTEYSAWCAAEQYYAPLNKDKLPAPEGK